MFSNIGTLLSVPKYKYLFYSIILGVAFIASILGFFGVVIIVMLIELFLVKRNSAALPAPT